MTFNKIYKAMPVGKTFSYQLALAYKLSGTKSFAKYFSLIINSAKQTSSCGDYKM